MLSFGSLHECALSADLLRCQSRAFRQEFERFHLSALSEPVFRDVKQTPPTTSPPTPNIGAARSVAV
jgi:hypothetical protein